MPVYAVLPRSGKKDGKETGIETGPYYGLYGVETQEKELHDSHGSRLCRAHEEPVIYPKMSGEDWNRVVGSEGNPEGRRKGGGGTFLYGSPAHREPGLYPDDRDYACGTVWGGQVVYYDEDFCGQPFFVREKGCLK